jgi:predicted nucleotidyltransferase
LKQTARRASAGLHYGRAVRREDVEEVLGRVTEWAARREDVRALALVGSWARGRARVDSDIDLVLLVDEPERYSERDEWAAELGADEVSRRREWGAITEHRLVLATTIQLDLGIGPASWAATDPVDSGTYGVVRDGMRVLHDPDGVLAALKAEVRRR